jgi:hypothetical protein
VPSDPVDATTAIVAEPNNEDNWEEFAETDPDVARAGRAVAARRRKAPSSPSRRDVAGLAAGHWPSWRKC